MRNPVPCSIPLVPLKRTVLESESAARRRAATERNAMEGVTKNDQVGVRAVSDVARDLDCVGNFYAWQILAIFARRANALSSTGIVSPQGDVISLLRPKHGERGAPASGPEDRGASNAHLRLKRCSVPLRRREKFERCLHKTRPAIAIEK